MNCLLVAATAKEIAPFLEYYRDQKSNLDVDVLVTGIGLTAATYHLTKQLQFKRPSFVLQAGVAGCFDQRLQLGSVVAVRRETIADQSVVEIKKLKTLFDLALVPRDQFPFKKGWMVNDTDLFKKIKLKTVTGISVNQITVSKEMISFYKKEFNPVTESMEGAALHYVCLMEKIPFLQIRSLSNHIGERNKKNWNMKQAIASLNRELITIIERF